MLLYYARLNNRCRNGRSNACWACCGATAVSDNDQRPTGDRRCGDLKIGQTAVLSRSVSKAMTGSKSRQGWVLRGHDECLGEPGHAVVLDERTDLKRFGRRSFVKLATLPQAGSDLLRQRNARTSMPPHATLTVHLTCPPGKGSA